MRWLIILLLLSLSGCIHSQKPTWTDVPSADQLLHVLAADVGRYDSLDGAATVSLSTDDNYLSTEQFLLLQRPNRIRVDALTGFGQLIFQMTSDGDVLSVLLNTSVPGRFMQGRASDENIARFIRVPLAMSELLPLLLYDPPLINFQHSRVEPTSDGLTLLLEDGSNRQAIYFDKQLHLSGSRYSRDGHDYLAVEYQKFAAEQNFPFDIRVVVPQQHAKIRLKFSEVQLNTKIDAVKFSLQRPNNVLVEPLPE